MRPPPPLPCNACVLFEVNIFGLDIEELRGIDLDDTNIGISGTELREWEHIRPKAEALLKNYITTNKGFDTAYKKGYEIWMDCKRYHYMDELIYSMNQDFIMKELR